VINQVRRRRLVELDVRWVELPTFRLPDSESVILAAQPVTQGLNEDRLTTDALALVDRARAAPAMSESTEDALVAGYNLLKRRAAARVGALPKLASASALDAAETDLRWAGSLQSRLVSLAFPAVLRTVEQHLHRHMQEQPAEEILELLQLAISVTAGCVTRLDPPRGQRVERVATYAIDLALAKRDGARSASRAAARHEPGSITLPATALRCAPWQAWLESRPGLEADVDRLEAEMQTVVRLRYGWSGTPPLSLADLATRLGTTSRSIACRLRDAEARLRALARGMD
jgi:hypothetical protein